MSRRLTGSLLVASPTVADPHFTRTVLFVVDHDGEGALALVLNRPTTTAVTALAPSLAELAGERAVVHDGGPIQQEAALALAEFRDPADAALLVLGRVGMVAAESDEPPDVHRARVFAGYAGWAPGQLEAEIARDDWLVLPTRADELFHPEPERLWHLALQRLGGPFALLAERPADPSVN